MKTKKALMIISAFILFGVSAFLFFEPSSDPSGYFVYTPSLAILKYEIQNNNIIMIPFITEGKNDLSIRLQGSETTRLACGNDIINLEDPTIIEKNKDYFTYKDYSCKDISYISISSEKDSEKIIEFKFGNSIQNIKIKQSKE